MIDLAVALGVALYLATGAWSIGRQSIDVLMDRELPDADRQKILDIVRRHPGVRSVHDLRTRSAGLHQFIQLHVVLHPTMSLGRAHVIGDSVEAAIREAFPQAEVILHIDPYDDDAREPADMTTAVLRRRGPVGGHRCAREAPGAGQAHRHAWRRGLPVGRPRLQAEARGEVPLHGFLDRRAAPRHVRGRGRDQPAAGARRSISASRRPARNDWVVVMRRFDEDGLLDRMAERGALTPALMAALGARIARYHDGLAPIRDGFGRPDDYRHSVAADIRQMLEQGDRLDPPTSEALAEKMPAALEPYIDLVARRVEAGAIRRCHGDLHLRNIVLIDGKPVPFDAIEFSERIANIDVLYDLSFALMDLCERELRPLANRLLNEWLWRIAELPGAASRGAGAAADVPVAPRLDPRLRRCPGRRGERRRHQPAPATTSGSRCPSCSPRRRG